MSDQRERELRIFLAAHHKGGTHRTLLAAANDLLELLDTARAERDLAQRDAVELSDALLHPWRKRDDAPLAARLAQYRKAQDDQA